MILKPMSFPRVTTVLSTLGVFSLPAALLAQTAPASTTSAALPAVEVSASRESADGPVIGYRATRSATVTRTDTSVEDIPRAISIVPAEVLRDVGEERIDRALDFAAGVARGNDFGGINMSTTNIRGFATGAQYRNGMGMAGNNRGSISAPDAANIERVEVLKGPASGLFGRGEPGGLINIVTKTPQGERFTRGTVSAGRWNRWRGTLDINTPLSTDASVLGRLNVALEDNGSFRDHTSNQRQALYPSVRWQLGADTSVLVNAELLANHRVFDRGIPAVGGHFGQVPIDRFYGEPSSGKIHNRHQLLQIVLEHGWHANWKMRLASQYYRNTITGGATETSAPLAATPDIIPRFYRDRNFRTANFSTQMDIQGTLHALGWRHHVLFGVEYERYRQDMRIHTTGSATNAYGIDLWNPIYGKPRPDFDLARTTDSLSREASHAVNLQDQIDFNERLIGHIGIRYDRLHPQSHNRATSMDTAYHRDAVVPRLGVLYKFTPHVSAFANASTSFQANGVQSTGEVYEPEKGVGYDLGLKLNLFEGRLGATLGAFHITKKNVKTPHPDPTVEDSITVGEQRSRGVDMQLSGDIARTLRVIAAYAFVDAEVTHDNRANYQGNRLAGVPRHNASLLAVYRLQGGQEWGAALNRVGARRASITSRFELPAYHTVDLFTRWPLPTAGADVTLRLNNLFNKEYYERGWSTWAGVPGDPRNIKLTVSFDL